jgi:EAL domain-containing protein (putative c-di-GMP-specific phosphodiesterase class I)
VTGRGARTLSDAWAQAVPGEPPIAHLIDRRGRCRLSFEPVADLARGVICGYEALPRYPAAMSPARWRDEAQRRGLEADLDAFLIGSVLDAREQLLSDGFLSFNVRAAALQREAVRARLAQAERLDGFVVELSPHGAPRNEASLLATIAGLRAAGATIAVDDFGSGTGALLHITAVRPELVKLDPKLVRGCHRDDAKLAIIETFGRLASRLDAWVVAQGVERIEELDALMRLRVPLAQGPLIGVPTKTLAPVAFPLAGYVRERGLHRIEPGPLVGLLERRPALETAAQAAEAFAAEPGLEHLALVDERRRPVGMVERAAFERGEPPAADVLVVAPSARIPEVAQRAILRPPPMRLHPLVCCDGCGRYLGVVRVEQLMTTLATACGG